MLNNINAVIFDLDGTIVNTNEVILRSMAETLERETGRPWSHEELLPHWGLVLRRQLRLLHPGIDLKRAVPFYRQCYQRNHDALLAEFPGVRAMLETLQAAGIKLGVVTSKKRGICLQTIADVGYGAFFPVVVTEEDTERLKPAPDPLILALQRLHASPEDAIYIGDNPDDIIAAHAAGMRAVAVGWSLRSRESLLAHHPEAIIDTPDELLALIPAFATSR
ncbi:MAG: HAD-IA family hydrolase [Armatimonadota bacterium]